MGRRWLRRTRRARTVRPIGRAVTLALALGLVGAAAGPAAPPPAGATTLPPQPAPTPSHEPVVLVPGWMGWPESMDLLAAGFRYAGYPTFIVDQNSSLLFPPLSFPSTNTDQNGPKLAATVDQALLETGAERVNLVGYSYGGLVARHYIKDLGGVAKVRRYVGIGVPQRGVTTACGLPYEETGHLCPGTPFILTLNRGDDTPGAIAYANIWGDEDGAGTVAVDGSVCVRHVAGVAHLGEPFSFAVAAEALARVQDAPCPAADRFTGEVPDAQGP
jgi:triacylglycerol lipase